MHGNRTWQVLLRGYIDIVINFCQFTLRSEKWKSYLHSFTTYYIVPKFQQQRFWDWLAIICSLSRFSFQGKNPLCVNWIFQTFFWPGPEFQTTKKETIENSPLDTHIKIALEFPRKNWWKRILLEGIFCALWLHLPWRWKFLGEVNFTNIWTWLHCSRQSDKSKTLSFQTFF